MASWKNHVQIPGLPQLYHGHASKHVKAHSGTTPKKTWDLPSGKHTKSDVENGPVEIVDFTSRLPEAIMIYECSTQEGPQLLTHHKNSGHTEPPVTDGVWGAAGG